MFSKQKSGKRITMSLSDNPITPPSGFPFVSNVPEKWGSENIDLLRDLIAQKLSALVIANTMTRRTEFTFTRNAIIGKARRLGLALLGNDNRPRPVIVKPPKKPNPVNSIKIRPLFPSAPKGPTFEEVVASPKCLTILEIERGQCYWPTSLAYDHEPVTFCGHATDDTGTSWCKAHQKAGYTKPQYRVGGWGYR